MIVLICLKTNEKKNSPSLKFGAHFMSRSLTVLAIFYVNLTLCNLTMSIQTKFLSYYLFDETAKFHCICIMIIHRSNQII